MIFVRQWLNRLKNPDSQTLNLPNELVKKYAYKQWEERKLKEESGSAKEDWKQAEIYLRNHPLIIYKWRCGQTIFATYRSCSTSIYSIGRFLWIGLPTSEWMKLVAVPLILAAAGGLIGSLFQEEQKQINLLRSYFDNMQKLLESNLESNTNTSVNVNQLVKARTLNILRSTDSKRKELIVQFLAESDMINNQKNGVSLSHLDLANINLSGSNLAGANFTKTKLTKTNLEEVKFTEIIDSEKNCSLGDVECECKNRWKANLSEANLSKANLRKIDFQCANLFKADLNGANIEETLFGNADLRFANLTEVNIVRRGFFENANLFNADFSRAKIKDSVFLNANLTGANLSHTNFNGLIELERANLFLAELEGANLQGVNLKGANLEGANLRKVNLREANLRESQVFQDSRRTNLTGANFEQADLHGANLRNANLQGANFHRANFSKADLSEAIIGIAFTRDRDGEISRKITDFRGAKNITPEQIKQANNWKEAKYDSDFRKRLGLPSEP